VNLTFSCRPNTSLGNPTIPPSSFHDVQSICSAVSLLRASRLPLCASVNYQLMLMYLQLLCVPQAAAISPAVVLQLVSVWIGVNVAIGWMLAWMECWLASAIRCYRYGASQCGSLYNALNPTLGLKNSFFKGGKVVLHTCLHTTVTTTRRDGTKSTNHLPNTITMVVEPLAPPVAWI
jgi:hypothetical protein